MRLTTHLSTLAFVTALAPAAFAQDSVSKLQALPGDAVDAHDAPEQTNDFVVDLAARKSSWNNAFGVAPLLKGSLPRTAPAPLFFTTQLSAQAMSRTIRSNVPFLRSSYSLWTTPGSGVNNDISRNDPGAAIDTSAATGLQFAAALSEFSTGATDPSGFDAALNGVVTGIVNLRANEASRLYVSRIVAGINGSIDSCNLAQIGMGVVDSHGNVHFRADNFGTTDCGGGTAATGQNLFRVRSQSRTSGVVNVLSGTGGTEATDQLLVNNGVTHNTPNAIPEQVAGRPILVGSNFNKDYVFEQSAGAVVAQNQAHFPAGITDHRGAMSYAPANFPNLFPAATLGTAAITGIPAQNVVVFGLGANGAVSSPIARTLPAVGALADNAPGETWTSSAVAGTQQFGHYFDQAAFRGGSGQMSIGQDQAGNLLVAGVVYYGIPQPSPNTNTNNYIAVAKIDPLTGATTWSVAAWTVGATAGKRIYQNGTTVIGRLKGWFGPTVSAPMFDSVGNVWFLGAIEIGGVDRVGLLRAVLDPATFTYALELVVAEGDVVAGRNSGRDYQIARLEISDGNSVSSGTAFSSNISAVAHLGQSTAGLATSDARTLGGLVIHAGIVYDRDDDGTFLAASTNPGSPDEDYRVLLYVAATADCNDNGIPDDREIADQPTLDGNGDGVLDTCQGLNAIAFCFGDGTGTACPCGNNSPVGANQGCLNSLGVGGRLVASGTSSLSNDTLVLTGTNLPNSSALYFQGTTQQSGGNGAVFGDGKRCAGGTIIRLGTKTSAGGTSQYPVGADLPVATRGLVTVPGVRTYQVWYRNAATFCTVATFNLSNGVQVTWQS